MHSTIELAYLYRLSSRGELAIVYYNEYLYMCEAAQALYSSCVQTHRSKVMDNFKAIN